MMTPEQIEQFRIAVVKRSIATQATMMAAQYIEEIQALSEQEVIDALSQNDIAFAVWFDPEADTLRLRKIYPPSPLEAQDGMRMHAIAVADEEEALHWIDLFDGTVTPRQFAKPRLVTENANR